MAPASAGGPTPTWWANTLVGLYSTEADSLGESKYEKMRKSPFAELLSDTNIQGGLKLIFVTLGFLGAFIAILGPLSESALANSGQKWLITAYCGCKLCCSKSPAHPAYGITASGNKVHRGMVAADSSIPFGTRLWIEGVGMVMVADRGGAIKGQHLDLYLPSHSQALKWGRQWRKVNKL